MSGPLARLRVVEYGQGVSAPYTGKLFADYGADVIKVEPPGGDRLRRRPPFAGDQPGTERSGAFFYLNTNKRSVVLDLDDKADRTAFRRLVTGADVFIENSPFGWLAGRGLDPDALRKENPGLVSVSVTPFGRTGPRRGYLGDDLVGSHAGGIAYTTRLRGFGEVRTDLAPLRAGGHQVSFIGGLAAAVGALMALYGRRRTGLGQDVDVAMQEVVISALSPSVAHYPYTGHLVGRAAAPLSAPICLMRCRDGWIWLQCSEEQHWRDFVKLMGSPDWAELEIFKDRFTRGEHWDALEPLLLEWTLQHDKEEIYRKAQALRVPHAPAYSFEELLHNSHLVARGFFPAVEHPVVGLVQIPGSPASFSKTPWRPGRPPLLGEHTAEVLSGEDPFR